MDRSAFLAACVCAPLIGSAQAIDSVFVEVFHVRPNEILGEPPLVTYRIFVDLAEGHELQMVYADQEHSMRIETTTYFYNETEHGVIYADRLDTLWQSDPAVVLDSWLTIGAVGDHHMGIPKELDTDGSIVECPPPPVIRTMTASTDAPARMPLCPVDGLMEVPATREVVSFRHEPGYLGKIKGSLIETSDGAWSVLGGIKGVTDRNILLIAQISTTGELSFKLNLQIETPDHRPVKYVASDAGEDEVLFKGLTYGYRPK